MNRREFMAGVGFGVAAIAVPVQSQTIARVKALMFDTFGTVVDWRGSIIQEGKAWNKERGVSIDWASFADRWRAGVVQEMTKVRENRIPWTNLDILLGVVLDDLLKEFRIDGLSQEEKESWNRVWCRLNP